MPAFFDPNVAEEAIADQHSPLVDLARKAGKDAYEAKVAEVGDAGAAGFVMLCLPIDETHKPLLRCLAENDIGSIGTWSFDYEISTWGLGIEAVVQSMEVQAAALEAVAAELRKSGFRPTIRSKID